MNTQTKLQKTKVLVLESEQTTDNSLNIETSIQQFTFRKFSTDSDFATEIKSGNYSLILINTDQNGIDTVGILSRVASANFDIPVILIADSTDESTMTTVGDSSIEILLRPVSSQVLLTKIKTVCEHYNTRKELLNLRQQVAMSYGFDNFVGLSREIMKIKRNIQHISANDSTIILSGQDGTGKNLLAKIIHYHSARRHSPLVSLDCSAFTPEQLETELFGTESGTTNETGILKRVGNGTLFLDKLNLLKIETQSKLESYLKRHANSTNFRLLISISEPVYDLVARNQLNKTLIDHLQAVEFTLPQLSERSEDIELLTAYFLRLITFENDSDALTITPAAVELLKRHHWPGNVRELENCLRRASALCNNATLDIADISFISINTAGTNLRDFVSDRQVKKKSLADSQRHLISEALDANDWNFTQTAKQLGIGRTTLWRKVRKFNLNKETEDKMNTSGVTTND